MVVSDSTPLENISQIGSFPQAGVKINNFWNHHLVSVVLLSEFNLRNTKFYLVMCTTLCSSLHHQFENPHQIFSFSASQGNCWSLFWGGGIFLGFLFVEMISPLKLLGPVVGTSINFHHLFNSLPQSHENLIESLRGGCDSPNLP